MALPFSLITPQLTDFIKDFPAQHAVNADNIDTFIGPCLTSDPLQTFNPVLKGSAGDPVLGTGGINRAFFYQVLNQVYMWGEVKFGSAGASFGGGVYSITLPFEVACIMGAAATFDFSPIVGSGTTYDDSSNAGKLPLTVHLKTPTVGASELFFGLRINSGSGNRDLRSAGYTTWAINDGISWNARVQRVT